MNKTFISGANGFIGSYLKDKFKAEGIPRKYLYSGNLDSLLEGAETVIHCASYGNMAWQKEISETFDANVLSTFDLLESCRKVGVKNFIFIGTSSEYGDKEEPMSEEMLPETKTMYGCTKVCGTYLTRHYSQYMNTVTIRPFSIYGEREDDRRFIPKLISSILTNSQFTLMEGRHDWLHIDDFCNAIDIVLKNMDLLSGLVINVGSGREFTNGEVLEILNIISGKKANIVIAPKKEQDSNTWVANNGKIRALGWKQRVSLYDGLKKVYDYKTASNQNM